MGNLLRELTAHLRTTTRRAMDENDPSKAVYLSILLELHEALGQFTRAMSELDKKKGKSNGKQTETKR